MNIQRCKSTTKSGKSCKNVAIDKTGFCRSHYPDVSKRPSKGTGFEFKVLKVLRLLGYKVEQNCLIKGCQVDVYGEFRTGIITLKLMVECKDYGEKKVGIEEINKFAGVVAVARNLGIVDKGLFVTTRGYTAEAKNNAQAAGIEVTTFEELSTQLVDFDDYLEKVISQFQTSSVSKYYIDLSGTEEEDYEGADESIFIRPIDKFVNKCLLEDDGRGKLALLGNFGTGKSTFCKKYAYDLASNYKQKKETRIPVVINLKEYDSKFHIQELIFRILHYRYHLNITSQICLELQRLGRFVFLFDGFDEMATKVDPEVIRENLNEINKVTEIPENKFVITCRTHFFRDKVQTEILTEFDLLYIPEWGEIELKEYLQKRFGKEWKSQLERISGTHNLPELAQTPLFLEMIVETLPKLGDEVKRKELYRIYTNNWIKEQSKRRGARLNSEQREKLVTELAMKMYLDGKGSCHYSEFTPIIREKLDIDDAVQMDYIRNDVQNCTFLIRDANGNYQFRHKSFMEFFVAQTLAKKILRGSNEILGKFPLPVEIRGFLVDSLMDNPPEEIFIKWLVELSDNSILRNNLLALMPRLKINIPTESDQLNFILDEDTKIASKLVEGDFNAFGEIYKNNQKRLLSYLIKRGCPIEVAEDVVVDAFLSIMQRKEQIEVENITAFLLKVVHYRFLDYRRKNSKTFISIDSDDIDFLTDFEEEADEDALQRSDELNYDTPELIQENKLQTSLEIKEAIERLAEDERQFLDFYFFQSLSVKEISEKLNISPSTVYLRKKNMQNKLKNILTSKR